LSLQFDITFPKHVILKGCDILVFNIFTTVEIQIWIQMELVIMNGMILVWERWWLKVDLGKQQIVFSLPFWCHCLL